MSRPTFPHNNNFHFQFPLILTLLPLFQDEIIFNPSLPSDAVKQITAFMGMQACERSDKVDPDKSSHSLMLAGVYRGGHDVLVKARLARSATQGVNMKITVRSPDLNACEMIAGAVG